MGETGTRDEGHDYAWWTAEWQGGMAADVSGRGHTLRVDEPPEYGGEDSGPMPTEMLVVALASCFCLAVAWAAGKKRIPLDDLRVHVRPSRAPGEPRHGSYEVWVDSSTDPEALAPAVELGKRYCWVTNTIATPPVLDYRTGSPLG